MITEQDLNDLHWHKRNDGGWWAFKTGNDNNDYFYQLYPPTCNATRTFFCIYQQKDLMYCGDIPDRAALISLMRWLRFPKYDKAGDPWNTEL